jgi:serine/threonine-protein kinase
MYMAPELLAGAAASERSDVYSLGLLLWFALAGRHPFDVTTLNELKVTAERGPQPPLAEACPGVSGDLVSVVERAITPDPNGRFGSASELLTALEGLPSMPAQDVLPRFRRSSGRAATSGRSRGLTRIAWAVAALAVLVAVLASVRVWQSDHGAQRTSRFELSVPAALIPLGPLRVSPGGTAVAFAATDSAGLTRLYVRPDAISVDRSSAPKGQDARSYRLTAASWAIAGGQLESPGCRRSPRSHLRGPPWSDGC